MTYNILFYEPAEMDFTTEIRDEVINTDVEIINNSVLSKAPI